MKNLLFIFLVGILFLSFQIQPDSLDSKSKEVDLFSKMAKMLDDEVMYLFKITDDFSQTEISLLRKQLELNEMILNIRRNEYGLIEEFTVAKGNGGATCTMEMETHGYISIGRKGSLGCGL